MSTPRGAGTPAPPKRARTSRPSGNVDGSRPAASVRCIPARIHLTAFCRTGIHLTRYCRPWEYTYRVHEKHRAEGGSTRTRSANERRAVHRDRTTGGVWRSHRARARAKVPHANGPTRTRSEPGRSGRGAPNGSRTRVTALKGPCPRPLDDGDAQTSISEVAALGAPAARPPVALGTLVASLQERTGRGGGTRTHNPFGRRF